MSGSRKSTQPPEASTSSASPAFGPSDFRFLRFLGGGSFGSVWFAQCLRNHQACAVKAIRRQTGMPIGRDGLTDFQREVDCMKRVDRSFPFIIRIFGHFSTPRFDFVVMEYLGCEDMKSLLKFKGPMPESNAQLYVAELGCALQYLHDRNIIHRDLKLENIVMSADGHVKLIDFGLSKVMSTTTTGSMVGTLTTMAPEVLMNGQYDYRADWYSLGVVLYMMLEGKCPFHEDLVDRFCFQHNVIFGTIDIPWTLTWACQDLLECMLRKDPRKRLVGFQNLLDHEWFEGYSPATVLGKLHQPRFVPSSEMALKLSQFDPNYENPAANKYHSPSQGYLPLFLHPRPPQTTTPPPETTTPPDSPR